jgi:hypothetical protein
MEPLLLRNPRFDFTQPPHSFPLPFHKDIPVRNQCQQLLLSFEEIRVSFFEAKHTKPFLKAQF